MATIIYIAGFRQHAGKTFTSLGIISRLLEIYNQEEIGYIKPVGQELFTLPDGRKIDKDAVIIKEFVLPSLEMDNVSPVRLGRGVTKEFLSSSNQQERSDIYKNSIDEAIEALSDKKVIIAEGTGHPGVGGIVNLSNREVSRHLDADIIYLAGGGIGKTLDMLEVDINYFNSIGARVKGIIFNKLIPGKVDEMKKYITEEYLTERFSPDGSPIHILGWIPEIEGLNKPSMRLVKKSFPNAVVSGDIEMDYWNRPCSGITIVSQSYKNFRPENHIKARNIVILSAYSTRRLKKVLEYNETLSEENKIAGILFTCTKIDDQLKKSLKIVSKHNVPAIYAEEDTSSADEKLYKSIKNTKIQSYDSAKNDLIVDAFKNHLDLDQFKKAFKLNL